MLSCSAIYVLLKLDKEILYISPVAFNALTLVRHWEEYLTILRVFLTLICAYNKFSCCTVISGKYICCFKKDISGCYSQFTQFLRISIRY